MPKGGAPNNGMFLDESSKGFLIEDNTIYNTTGDPVRHNRNTADGHTWGKNYYLPSPSQTAQGTIGWCLQCRNGSQLMVPNAPVLEPEQLTLEAWCKTPEIPTGEENRRWIASKNANEWENGHYALIISGNHAGAYLNIGGGPNNMYCALSPIGAIKRDQWQHLAMTYDGVTLTLYCDGKAVGAQEIKKKRTTGSGPFCIGARPDGFIAFTGSIDEVRLYDRVLTADAIKARCTQPTTAPPDGSVGYWGFDDNKDNSTQEAIQQAIKQAMMQAGVEAAYQGRLLDTNK